MGAEREDTEPKPKRPGTEPGLGQSSGSTPAAAADDEAPPPVDFDALHAALGDPLDYEELSSGPALEVGADGTEDLLDEHEPTNALRVGESSGQSSATYASARPRTIPPSNAPIEDPNAPAVIVASQDTVPSAAPNMTVPMPPQAGQPHGYGGAPAMSGPMGRPPGSNPNIGMHGHPSSGQHPSAVPGGAYSQTPMPFRTRAGGVPQMTIRMPDRPVNPRRGKTATIVVRPRGPSAKQKLVAFMAMLLLVTACGIAVIIWRKPRLLGLEGALPSATASAVAAPALVAPSAAPVVTGVVIAPAAVSALPIPSTSASAKKVLKPIPSVVAPTPHPSAR